MNREIFSNMLNKAHISLTENMYNQFDTFYELLVEWNKVMNLTGITEYDEVCLKHYIDSVILANVFDLSKVKTCMDMGTGAGFPGLPLKIMNPEIEFTLLDSLNKRINFINEVIKATGLQKIKAVHGRAEDFARNQGYRENYDLCVSRAVANLASLSEYCLPFVKVGGHFVAYKSGKIEEELEESRKAIKVLGGEIIDTKYICLPESDIERAFVIIRKNSNTSKKYPRKAGTPVKEPIK